ncbi:GTP-binding protein TypA [Candidatus Uhrbacteria bacterium RIFCSPHIGHO2_12_FULL_60_25]|uniref:Large ribosomal subunit assembly factor BipA n=1 Tax=Candidatus Uhrbacteria bacterium RIFCSPHIGHO2_12_FULL_60_25 TaxID=1802399 RepID=A0A1F7UIL4_9BACT|nr:MAG: GTP-binding protein TypA [Candidatus Uhrbacteria bacterium RIFCSPHIGHO2_02_FULL_60_44]OGL78130.1 MAG: GTP-binding protein TypA [Candidatus Uhrbacteria bacterium RIFCSPHIGHO2_12_FULL_60_25]
MELRNIAIIAHVDHGKTTLVDSLLKQSDSFREKGLQGETIMDTNPLERERGITILAKNAAVMLGAVKINIVDTPGHADFGGEVERIMNLVDGALLLVDAKEGPMPQTRFVLKKALEAGHRIIVVINKIDKPDARPDWVLDQTFDLFVTLGASDRQTDFPVVYASAKQGKAGVTNDLASMKDVRPLFETILKEIPAPTSDANGPLQVSVANVSYDNYKGKTGVGRVVRGTFKPGPVAWINREGKTSTAKVTSVMTFMGMERVDVPEVQAGDIVAFAGIPDVNIGETIADVERPERLPVIKIEEPTVKMTFGINTSPFAGQEGEYTTTRNIKERLEHELQNDVALKVEPGQSSETFVVSGRGELHLSILIERMRREGFELQVSRPQVIFKTVGGQKSEPFEQVEIEVPEAKSGIVIEKLGKRKGELKNLRTENGIAYIEFEIPTRGLIGYRNEFMIDTRGQGIINTLLLGYRPYAGDLTALPHGSLVSFETGESNSYGLQAAQERGELFIGPVVKVYEGMVVGQNAKPEDLVVNVCKEKRLSNMRSKGEGVAEGLTTPRPMGLELALEYIGDDELVEVTPKSIRIRKLFLKDFERKRASQA